MSQAHLIEVKVPDIGDFAEVTVIELLVKPGDSIKAEQSLITVESDKASMEIPASHAGVVKEIRVKLGDKVKEGSVVLMLEAAAGASAAPASEPVSAPAQTSAPAAASPAPAALAAAAPSASALPAAPTSTATCWCWALAPAAIRLLSARPIWA
jgi:pyruvate dehydrogenase E2 component (dihydrolipoamide acetyltransferase)